MHGDAELLRRYVEERSEAAFAELVRRHLNLVYFAALRQVGGNTHTAEEVAQTVFTDLARKAASLCQRPVLASWLHTSTHFAATKARRAEWRRNKYEQEAQTMPDFLPNAASTAEWERLRPTIDDVFHDLNETDREAVLQRYFEGHSFSDIGAALNLSEDAARMRVERALEKLRALLARRGVTSTAVALSALLANEATASAPAGLATTVAGQALATAGATSASALNLFQLLSNSTLVLGALALVGVLAIGTATCEVIANRDVRAELGTSTSERDALQARLHDLEHRARLAEQSGAALRKAVRDQRAAKAAAESRASAIAAAEARERGQEFLNAHPEVRQALVAEFRARCVGEYAPLYKMLGLTAVEIEQFEALAPEVNGPMTFLNGRVIQLNPGTGMSVEEADERRRTLLGEDRYKKLLEFDKLNYARTLTTQLASALCFTDAPLTATQAEQMVRWMDEGNITRRGKKADWDGVFAKSQGALSPAQLAALGALRTQHEFDQGVNQAIAVQK